MAAPLFITAQAVAEQIGVTAKCFMRIRPRLERENLFPLPMPTARRPLRWRADEVAAWVARQGRPCPIDLPADPQAAAIATGRLALTDLARSA